VAWTYILRCSDGSFYTGSTDKELDARVWEHNHDDVLSAHHTRTRRPVVVVYAEQFGGIELAFARERQLHGWSRANKLALIEERGADLPGLSRSSGDRGTE
jgi:putative endonuclease